MKDQLTLRQQVALAFLPTNTEISTLHSDRTREKLMRLLYNCADDFLAFESSTSKAEEPKAVQTEPAGAIPPQGDPEGYSANGECEPVQADVQTEEPKIFTTDDLADRFKALMREDKAVKPKLLALLTSVGAKRTSEVKAEDVNGLIPKVKALDVNGVIAKLDAKEY